MESKKFYFKTTNKDEKYRGFQYCEGLNVFDGEFINTELCSFESNVSNGIYFTDSTKIFGFFFHNSIYLRKVILPKDDPDFKMVLSDLGNEWRANKIILGKKRNLSDLDTIKYLISKGANINSFGGQILEWASAMNHFDIVQYLVRNGADIHAFDDHALIMACEYGNLKVVEFLISKGATMSAGYDYPIVRASSHGHLEVVKFLFSKGANTSNHFAIENSSKNGHIDVVKFLVEHGANPNTAIVSASKHGHIDIVKYLIRSGAFIICDNTSTDRDNYNCAKELASTNGHTEVVNFLLSKEAKYYIKYNTFKMIFGDCDEIKEHYQEKILKNRNRVKPIKRYN